MTREEAIKVLRTESIELGGSATSVCRFLEALDMAVRALEDAPDKDVGKMTNAQKIRSMSKEYPELFECDISETVESCEECGFCEVKADKETLNEQGCRH